MTIEEIHELISKLKHEDITEHEADLIYDYMTYGFKDRNYSKITKLWLEEVLSQVSKGRTGMFLSTFPIDGTAFPEFFDLNRTIVEAISDAVTNCIFYFMQRQSVPYFAAEIYPYDGCIMTGAAEAEVFNGMTAEIVEAVRKMASGRNNWPDGIPNKLYERFSEAFAETFYSKLKERKELDTEIKKEQDNELKDGSWTDITR